jgi:hypothetical protein
MKRDDSDDLPLSSHAEYSQTADHGKEQHQEKQARSTGKLLALKRQLLKTDVKQGKSGAVDDEEQKDADQQDKDAAKQQQEKAKADPRSWATKGSVGDAKLLARADATGEASPDASKLQQLRQKIVKEQTQVERPTGNND